MIHFLLALLSILSRQKCLIDIGTKGGDAPLRFALPKHDQVDSGG
jgi:hypothetical protein